jgi:hypothetical protein
VTVTPDPENNPVFPMTLDLRWPAPARKAKSELQGLVS